MVGNGGVFKHTLGGTRWCQNLRRSRFPCREKESKGSVSRAAQGEGESQLEGPHPPGPPLLSRIYVQAPYLF